jgi:hypothetical protein
VKILIRHAPIAQRLRGEDTIYAVNRHWPGLRERLMVDRRGGWRDWRRGSRLQGGGFDRSKNI